MGVSIAGVAAALALSACGGGTRLGAHEPSGKFRVSVPTARFPASQHISGHYHMVIAVHNDGRRTIPEVAVTICNVTCAYPRPRSAGPSTDAFATNISGQYLANSSRPTWVVEQGPGTCGFTCAGGGQGGGQGEDQGDGGRADVGRPAPTGADVPEPKVAGKEPPAPPELLDRR